MKFYGTYHIKKLDYSSPGYNLPKDTMVLFNVWSLHHDSRYWKHPMKFDPTR